jgi:hypothetical protein
MSGPITSGAVSRKEKEVLYVVKNIDQRLSVINAKETFSTYKVKMFTVVLVCLLGGILLLLLGTHSTVLFQEYKFNPTAVVIGAFLCVPMLIWVGYMIYPPRLEHQRRRIIKVERKAGTAANLYETIAEQARKHAEPPPRRIKVYARLRKKDHVIIASTWQEFCEALENQTGLPVEQQIIKYRDEELQIDFKLRLDENYRLDNGDRLYIYNRGGFRIDESPVKKQYDAVVSGSLIAENAATAEEDDFGNWRDVAFRLARHHKSRSKPKERVDADDRSLGNSSIRSDFTKNRVSWRA